ncbi:MAG: hypothetical protein K2O24_06815 [Muribaculaceae bacterium]|nr:hypothetical protein [Muribaculaceae bacterium]
MVNKREFKKYVDAVGASVCNGMMEAYYGVEGIDKEAVAQAVTKVLGAIGAAKSNANRYFDRGPKGYADMKEYARAKREFFRALFKKITEDFSKEVDEALKQFNAAIPESARKANISA